MTGLEGIVGSLWTALSEVLTGLISGAVGQWLSGLFG